VYKEDGTISAEYNEVHEHDMSLNNENDYEDQEEEHPRNLQPRSHNITINRSNNNVDHQEEDDGEYTDEEAFYLPDP
jgi:hypothetical protein